MDSNITMELEELKVLLKHSVEITSELAAELVKFPHGEPRRVETPLTDYVVYHIPSIDHFWIQCLNGIGTTHRLVDANA